MYYEDYYDEPSEFEQQIAEFKDSLVKAVKKEHQEEIERLRRENAELQGIKSRIKQIELEHAESLRHLKAAEERAVYEAKRARLKELLSENFIQGWGVENRGEKFPKCEKCDKNRYIHYKTPSGKGATERCDCDARMTRYEPLPIECYEFHQSKTTYGGEKYPRISVYFSRKEDRDHDEYNRTRNIYKGEPFKEVDRYGIAFLNKEKCQEYCDWLNAKANA